jgi:hypothetical protein
MLLSSLLSSSLVYRQTLFQGSNLIPNVISIQALLQQAWQLGFDVEGGKFFHYKLKERDQIGISDIAALFRANSIPTRIVDFRKANWPIVEQFCFDYFATKRTSKELVFPLLLGTGQHTIVVIGTHVQNREKNLLVFDPAMSTRDAFKIAEVSSSMFFAKRKSLVRFKDFQVAVVGPWKLGEDLLLTGSSVDKMAGGKVLIPFAPADLFKLRD